MTKVTIEIDSILKSKLTVQDVMAETSRILPRSPLFSFHPTELYIYGLLSHEKTLLITQFQISHPTLVVLPAPCHNPAQMPSSTLKRNIVIENCPLPREA